MNLSEDQLLKNMLNTVAIEIEILFNHTSTNGLVFQANIM